MTTESAGTIQDEFNRIHEAIERMLVIMETQQTQIDTLNQHQAVLRDKLQIVCLMVGTLDNLPDGSLRDRIHNLEVVNGMDPADDEIQEVLKTEEGAKKES